MKKVGILNSEIAKVLADLGHTDTICIADVGLPIPSGVKKIDLALDYGTPSFLQVLKELDKYLIYERITLAKEIKTENSKLLDEIIKITDEADKTYISHEEFKKMTSNCKAIIRTGENKPYANIILHSGVFFGLEV